MNQMVPNYEMHRKCCCCVVSLSWVQPINFRLSCQYANVSWIFQRI